MNLSASVTEVDVMEVCPNCKGIGYVGDTPMPCHPCKAQGVVVSEDILVDKLYDWMDNHGLQ